MAGRGLGHLNHEEAHEVPQVMTEPGKKPSSTPTSDHNSPPGCPLSYIRHFNTHISNNLPWTLEPSSDA